MINESILHQKIQSLLQYPILNKQLVKTIADILKTLDDLLKMGLVKFNRLFNQALNY